MAQSTAFTQHNSYVPCLIPLYPLSLSLSLSLSGHERDAKMSAGLCLETLNMLNYLTSDEVPDCPARHCTALHCTALYHAVLCCTRLQYGDTVVQFDPC
jgi:hypothetical protein